MNEEINVIDWDADERLIVSCEKRIKHDIPDDDDIHQFSDYQHSFYEPMTHLGFFGGDGFGASIDMGSYK